MKKVIIQFRNIQSHEYTEFYLEPGVNFILANDNNVGKSTIFKLLTTVAKSPANSPAKLDSLLRTGCSNACARFEYGNEVVIFWIEKVEGFATRAFFEHDIDGVITRTVNCPSSLLDALGITLHGKEPLNFNDADSVQLISKSSVEADSIITYVMLDEVVETVKDNMQALSKEMTSDYKMISARKETAEEFLKGVSYNDAVEDFFDMLETYEAVCEIADNAPASLLQESIPSVPRNISEDLEGVEVCIKIASELQNIDFDSLSSKLVDPRFIDDIGKVLSSLKSLTSVYNSLFAFSKYEHELSSLSKEMNAIRKTLKDNCKVIKCPMKGSVYYSDEKCIPCSD